MYKSIPSILPITALSVVASFCLPAPVFAEDGPPLGPHGGHVVPAAGLQVELAIKGSGIEIHLIDQDSKPVPPKRHVLLAGLLRKKFRYRMNCIDKAGHWACALPKDAAFQRDDRIVVSVKEKTAPRFLRVSFKIPLE